MIAFAWHVFLVVWCTGCIVFAMRTYTHSPNRELSRSVERQVLQTRLAELQARERKALDVHH